MTTHYDTILVTAASEHVLLLTLNRPNVRNAINSIMMSELHHLWSHLDSQCRCIIITGQGDKAFSAGADLKERHGLDEVTWKANHHQLQQAMLAMCDSSVPIIAAVNGFAYGGGFELALASDFIYASTTATFALPEVRLGIMPGAMGTQHLPRACGMRRAKEIILSGRPFNANQALQWGIVNDVLPPDQLIPEVIALAEVIASNAPLSVVNAKAAINYAGQADLAKGYATEVTHYNQLLNTADRTEGIAAFNEKRTPQFKGE